MGASFETFTGTDELTIETAERTGNGEYVLNNDYAGGQGSYESYGYYRYGFNGKENDNEVKGQGNQQDYGMRIYDNRLGRFLSVDPLTKSYPMLTPYQFASNRPIDGIDLDGMEYLDVKKYNRSLWGLSKFETLSSSYTLGHLEKRNLEIHNIVMNHPVNLYKKTERLEDPEEVNDMVVKKRANSNRSQAFSTMEARTARREGSGDIVGGVVDFIKWSLKTSFELRYKKELEFASASITALDKADNLVRTAISNPSFPKNLLSSSSLKADLVNYLTDHTIPIDASFFYKQVVVAWGDLLFNNKEQILDNSFNFSPVKTIFRPITLNGPSGIIINLGFVTETIGNADPEVIKANELIQDKTPIRDPVIKSNQGG